MRSMKLLSLRIFPGLRSGGRNALKYVAESNDILNSPVANYKGELFSLPESQNRKTLKNSMRSASCVYHKEITGQTYI